MIKNQLDKYGRADFDDSLARAGLPRDFANEWYEKADGITVFAVPVINMDAAELRAVVAYLAEKVSVLEGRPRPPLLRRPAPKPASPAIVPQEGFTYTVIGGNL